MHDSIQPLSVQPTHCANCGTPLQGEWCHVCGQSTHHVLRHLPGLLEDAAEMLFHLNGRVLRTLPALYLFPGRLTREYLAGRRVRYVSPFRLMFVLCLISFFFAHLSMNIEGGSHNQGSNNPLFSDATTPRAVLDRLDTQLAMAGTVDDEAKKVPGLSQTMQTHNDGLDRAAIARLREVLPGHPVTSATSARIDTLLQRSIQRARTAAIVQRNLAIALAVIDVRDGPGTARDGVHAQLQSAAGARLAQLQALQQEGIGKGGVQPSWLPASVYDYFEHHLQRLKSNAYELHDGSNADRERVIGHVFSALPPSMLVLIPLFALLLQVLYLFHHRLYMEHLIVALHSHAFLFLSLLVLLALNGLASVLPHWAAMPVGWLQTAAKWWIPIYLLLMQKRVYGQGWAMTSLKYLIAGTAYAVMLAITVVMAVLIGLSG